MRYIPSSISIPNIRFPFSILLIKSYQFFQLCDTYPRYLYVPSTCTNNILLGSARFRSRGRLPVLTYLHSNKVKKKINWMQHLNKNISNKIIFQAAICRCSQPLSGFSTRCPEDEQMMYNILCTNPNSRYMYVVDTRPRVSIQLKYNFLLQN